MSESQDLYDGRLTLADGRTLAWHEWGTPAGIPLLRLQGTPGSRLARYPDLSLWERLGIRVIMVDRPGYGASDRKPGRGLLDVADDLAALLDHLGLDRVHLAGGSGGGPHVLAMCAAHPARVRAATVVVGGAPLAGEDVDALIGLNAEAYRRFRAGGWEALHELLSTVREGMLADPLGGFGDAMRGAPESDRAVMADPQWQRAFVEGLGEALRPGAEGWTDESAILISDWADAWLDDISTGVVWWHGRHDANAPLASVQRLLTRLPTVELRVWESGGHLEPYHREQEIVQELLAR